MSLIKFEEYTGSLVAQAVAEALEMIGIINKLNINGYTVSISGVQEPTPKGMIEDTPTKHEVVIERSMFVQSASKGEFKKINEDTEKLRRILEQQECVDINFATTKGERVYRGISRDNSGYVWYKHRVDFRVDQLAIETPENYVKRLFELIANYVIAAFEQVQ